MILTLALFFSWLPVVYADESLSLHFDCLNTVFFRSDAGPNNVRELSLVNEKPKTYMVINVQHQGQPGFYVFSRNKIFSCPMPKTHSQIIQSNSEHRKTAQYNVRLVLNELLPSNIIFSKPDSENKFDANVTRNFNASSVNVVNLGPKECITAGTNELAPIRAEILSKLEDIFSNSLPDKLDQENAKKACSGIPETDLAISKGQRNFKPANPNDFLSSGKVGK
jgi:hypothetical protein